MRRVFWCRKFIKRDKLRQEISYDWQARGHDGIVLPFMTLGLYVFFRLFRQFPGQFLLSMRIPHIVFTSTPLAIPMLYSRNDFDILHHIDDESYLICYAVSLITENESEKPSLALETKLQRRWRTAKRLQVTFTLLTPLGDGKFSLFRMPTDLIRGGCFF